MSVRTLAEIIPRMSGKHDNAELLERIDSALKDAGLSARKASLDAKLGPDAIRSIKRGHAPRAEALKALAKTLGKSDAYFLEAINVDVGRAPDLPVSYDTAISSGMIIEVGRTEYTALTRYDCAVSAGEGSILDPNAEPMDYHFVQTRWLETITRAKPDHLAILRVDGDSMISTLFDGDWVLIDRTQARLGREGIYAMAVNDVAWIKRLSLNLADRLVRIISDNPAYPLQELHEEEIAIIGRAIYVVGRRLG